MKRVQERNVRSQGLPLVVIEGKGIDFAWRVATAAIRRSNHKQRTIDSDAVSVKCRSTNFLRERNLAEELESGKAGLVKTARSKSTSRKDFVKKA
jgi:hypothetical protein